MRRRPSGWSLDTSWGSPYPGDMARTVRDPQRDHSQVAIRLLRLRARFPGRRLRFRKPVDVATMLGITALFLALLDHVGHWEPASPHRTIALYVCRVVLVISVPAALLSLSLPPVEPREGFDLAGWLSGRTQQVSPVPGEANQNGQQHWNIWHKRQKLRRQRQ